MAIDDILQHHDVEISSRSMRYIGRKEEEPEEPTKLHRHLPGTLRLPSEDTPWVTEDHLLHASKCIVHICLAVSCEHDFFYFSFDVKGCCVLCLTLFALALSGGLHTCPVNLPSASPSRCVTHPPFHYSSTLLELLSSVLSYVSIV